MPTLQELFIIIGHKEAMLFMLRKQNDLLKYELEKLKPTKTPE